MKISTWRSLRDETDFQRMADVARSAAPEHLHTVDLPYRFSSWAFDDLDNAALWFNELGEPVAWAALQAPWWTFDFASRPDCHAYMDQLEWAMARARAVQGMPYERPCWFVNVFRRHTEHIQMLEAAGFASQEKVEEAWSKVLMRHPLSLPLTAPRLPDGFRIRPLGGAAEVEAYVELHRAVFDSKTMTVEWRARTLQRPEYRPELDLVMEEPDGRLVAFCIGWFDPAGRQGMACGQIEPLGVHPDFRKLGLGRAILTEELRCQASCGAREMYVETDNYRDEAFQLYERNGFSVIEDVLVFRRDHPADW